MMPKYDACHIRIMFNISDAVNEIGLLLVKLSSLIAQSHMTFFDVLAGIFSHNAFPSPVISINPFSHQ